MDSKKETVATLSCGCRAVCWKVRKEIRVWGGRTVSVWRKNGCEIERDGCEREHAFLWALLENWHAR